MRIISQSGMISVEFSRVHLGIYKREIIAKDTYASREFSLGRYETEEMAIQVFNEIHEEFEDSHFSNQNRVFHMP